MNETKFFFLVPLTMGYVTRYIYGTDKLRPNGFEVYGIQGVKSGIIFCDSPALLSQWLKYISDNISALLQLEVSMFRTTIFVEVHTHT